jgi:hypothetical protein
MVDSISPLPPISPSQPPPENTAALSNQLQSHIDTLSKNFSLLLEDPTMAGQDSFLQEVASSINGAAKIIDQTMHLRG